MKIVGIDPGINGAIAYLDSEELIVYDMPVIKYQKNGKTRNKINPIALYVLLNKLDADKIYIEMVSGQPNNGSKQAFAYGWGCGTIDTCTRLICPNIVYVSPQKWKRAMEVTKDKNSSLRKARELFHQYDYFDRKKDDGRAEASLIAFYGSML